MDRVFTNGIALLKTKSSAEAELFVYRNNPERGIISWGLGIFTGQEKAFLLEKANVNAVEFHGYFSV